MGKWVIVVDLQTMSDIGGRVKSSVKFDYSVLDFCGIEKVKLKFCFQYLKNLLSLLLSLYIS